MKLEILGSGGAVRTPRPLCTCGVCTLARSGKPEDSRLGPSVFIHGPDILIDTPEDISTQINRSRISRISACLYSHWHPDHTAGKRVFEMNLDWTGLPPKNSCTKVIMTTKIAESFGQCMDIMNHFKYFVHLGIVDLVTIGNEETYSVGDYTIQAIQMAMDYSFGWRIAGLGKELLVIMDELKNWNPDPALQNTLFDLVYLPLGILDVNPITGQRLIPADHPILLEEQTVAETLQTVQGLNARHFVLSHIEEPDGISCAMGDELAAYWSRQTGKNITLAQDSQLIEI